MYYKGLLLIICATVIAATLVVLRQQRLEHSHAMTSLHRRMDDARQRVWNLQADIAEHLEPRRLQDAIMRVDLPLETTMPIDQPVSQPFYLVNHREERVDVR